MTKFFAKKCCVRTHLLQIVAILTHFEPDLITFATYN